MMSMLCQLVDRLARAPASGAMAPLYVPENVSSTIAKPSMPQALAVVYFWSGNALR